MNKDEVMATLREIATLCALVPAFPTKDERAVSYQLLPKLITKVRHYCADHAAQYVGNVKHLDDAIFRLHQDGVSREETDQHLAAARGAMAALEQCLHGI